MTTTTTMSRLALAVVLAAAARPAGADPSVIRDNRLADLGITPTLGRGYSPAANAMYSVCFATMTTTAASFDFDYTFEQIEVETTATATVRRDRPRTGEVADFVRSNTRAREVVNGKVKSYLHYTLATLVVDSYYSSLDEAHAKLSDAAVKLLSAGDVLGFFSGCGSHYVRSIGRRSYFLTLFSYSSSERTRDATFERKLEHAIRRLTREGKESVAEREDSGKFSDEARRRELRVVSKGIGLVAQTTATLIPFDLAAYKDAVKAAFKASQSELSGRISSIEITPWLANPTVLATLELPDPANAGAGAPRPSRYERKQVLADNAELYLSLVERTREVELLVHKAGVCRQELEDHVLVGGKLPPALAGAHVVNHRTGALLPVRELVTALDDAHLAALDAAERGFSAESDAPGAARCIVELERTGLVGKPHHELPGCASLPNPSLPGAAMIDGYCMPELRQ